MVKIRLSRLGRKKRPFYRIVAINSRSSRDGKFLEILGTYDPLQDPSVTNLDIEKINNWISKGAQLSNRVLKLVDPEKYGELVKDKPKRKPKAKRRTKNMEEHSFNTAGAKIFIHLWLRPRVRF